MGRSKRRARRPAKTVILTIVSKDHGTIVSVDKDRLVYRAEGNANLVLAIPDLKQVLRLRKSPPKDNERSTAIEHVIMVTEYARIVSSLFSECLTIEPKLVLLRIPNYDSLNKWLNQFRPSARCDKEIRCRAGILYPDLAVLRRDLLPPAVQVTGDTFCVEIKPKQGWIHPESTLNALFPECNSKLCRFCAMQYLKLVKKTIKRVSNYCPIDLFSGDRDRMLRALRGLVETPQNNFRMWRAGQLIYGDAMDAGFRDALEETMHQGDFLQNLDNFLQLLLEAILKDYTGEDVPNADHQLPAGSVLQQILTAQLFARDNLSIAMEKSTDEEHSFANIDRILAKTCDNPSEDWLSSLDGVEKYFLGATALDCSLMMTFQKVAAGDTEEKHTIHVAGGKFIVSMTVMDLDPKADSHPFKYVKQTRMSYNAHSDFVASG
ncbi:inositol-pentakisphosphate 2-kinase [Phlebotomus argentipes]|uniref:inositol-pentakisphosphate 2-kinase n=1 Tax=Phlebotomus argentipes TaxID=94469 RepID=UPI002892B537|nr:inositol-pentakisphosphate 2-kinase [Phlebotomus argentipes]XP_059613516.1 inositol-pentakisphosphate 2-kinase [Phlebotomus argentipes]